MGTSRTIILEGPVSVGHLELPSVVATLVAGVISDHAPQCIAHLLLTHRRVDRHPNKGCLTRWPEFLVQSLYADRQIRMQALYHVARDEHLMQLTKTLFIIKIQ
jgi:hypothetical protein